MNYFPLSVPTFYLSLTSFYFYNNHRKIFNGDFTIQYHHRRQVCCFVSISPTVVEQITSSTTPQSNHDPCRGERYVQFSCMLSMSNWFYFRYTDIDYTFYSALLATSAPTYDHSCSIPCRGTVGPRRANQQRRRSNGVVVTAREVHETVDGQGRNAVAMATPP